MADGMQDPSYKRFFVGPGPLHAAYPHRTFQCLNQPGLLLDVRKNYSAFMFEVPASAMQTLHGSSPVGWRPPAQEKPQIFKCTDRTPCCRVSAWQPLVALRSRRVQVFRT